MIFRMVVLMSVVATAIFGCATLSDKAAKVQVHSQVSNLLDSCKKLGPVTATASNILGQDEAFEAAKVKLREEAADMGGDTVAILNTDTLLTKVTIQGIAFQCY